MSDRIDELVAAIDANTLLQWDGKDVALVAAHELAAIAREAEARADDEALLRETAETNLASALVAMEAARKVRDIWGAMCEKRRTEAEVQRKRGDFFRDALDALHECPPVHLDYPCKGRKGEACPYDGDDGIDYAACWDEVERRQR